MYCVEMLTSDDGGKHTHTKATGILVVRENFGGLLSIA